MEMDKQFVDSRSAEIVYI